MKKFKNTLQKGQIRFIIFRENDRWYGAALEFNIIEEGDNPQDVLLRTFQAVEGYLESAQKIKARPHILNQKVDPELKSLWSRLEEKKGVPYDIYSYGRQLISV